MEFVGKWIEVVLIVGVLFARTRIIATPLVAVSQHIIETPGVRQKLPYRMVRSVPAVKIVAMDYRIVFNPGVWPKVIICRNALVVFIAIAEEPARER